MIDPPLLALLGALAATVGALGGLGGAVLLVPVLVVAGLEPAEAAPLGMLSVAAGSLAAAALQLDRGLVHHRLGVTVEIAASAGAIAGAALTQVLHADVLRVILALTALLAAGMTLGRVGLRNRPVAAFVGERAGEWPGTLSGAYRLGDAVVPYTARRLPTAFALMAGVGLVAGVSGTSGGFLKTPVLSEVMHVPVKVAAATTTFTVAATSAASLLVYVGFGGLDVRGASAVVLGALVGGRVGALLQEVMPAPLVRRVLGAVLVAVAAVLLVGA